jgi:hypothetical protein
MASAPEHRLPVEFDRAISISRRSIARIFFRIYRAGKNSIERGSRDT